MVPPRSDASSRRSTSPDDVRPFGDQRDHRMRAMPIVLGRIRAVESGDVAREIDHRRVHAVADAEIRNLVLARVSRGGDLAFETAFAEAAGHEDAVDVVQRFRSARLDFFGFEPAQIHARGLLQAAMTQRFAERFVRILVLDVLADDGDGDFVFRMLDGFDRAFPLEQIRRLRYRGADARRRCRPDLAGAATAAACRSCRRRPR